MIPILSYVAVLLTFICLLLIIHKIDNNESYDVVSNDLNNINQSLNQIVACQHLALERLYELVELSSEKDDKTNEEEENEVVEAEIDEKEIKEYDERA